MKVTINKKAFTWDEADKAIAKVKELKECESLSASELKRMADFYIGNTSLDGYYNVSAVICRNGNPLMESSEDYDTTIDTWIEMFIIGYARCRKVGFYLNDYYTLGDSNREQVMRKAFIVNYNREK